MEQLCTAPQGRGPDNRALCKIREIAAIEGDEGIAHILTGQVGLQQQPCRLLDGHVLHGVHRNIDLPGQQVVLDFAGEQPLATQFLERLVCFDQKSVIPGCFDDHNFKRVFRQIERSAQTPSGFIRLSKGERGATCANFERRHW